MSENMNNNSNVNNANANSHILPVVTDAEILGKVKAQLVSSHDNNWKILPAKSFKENGISDYNFFKYAEKIWYNLAKAYTYGDTDEVFNRFNNRAKEDATSLLAIFGIAPNERDNARILSLANATPKKKKDASHKQDKVMGTFTSKLTFQKRIAQVLFLRVVCDEDLYDDEKLTIAINKGEKVDVTNMTEKERREYEENQEKKLLKKYIKNMKAHLNQDQIDRLFTALLETENTAA